MDVGMVISLVSEFVSLGAVVVAFVRIGIYKGQNDMRVASLERNEERMQKQLDDAVANSDNIEKKLEGLTGELKTSMAFITKELNEIKEEVRGAKAKQN